MLRSAGDCTRCGEAYCNGDGDAYGAAEATVCLVNDNIGVSKALRALLESTRLAAARNGLMIAFVRIYFSVRLNLPVLERFGASAPADVLLREYGFTVDSVCARAQVLLDSVSAGPDAT